MTFPIQVDATHLTTPRFLIAGVTGWLETTSIHSGLPSLSADAQCVAFSSEASNLVPDDTNGCYDVFVAEWRGPG